MDTSSAHYPAFSVYIFSLSVHMYSMLEMSPGGKESRTVSAEIIRSFPLQLRETDSTGVLCCQGMAAAKDFFAID